ncbi:MAG: FAD-dependent monooxygenase [Candidatus Lokiarchaeota archaeon]|nr:FAD-dependent monooxygenase [Candidatus Lokiarchaeota archaeon]
MTKEKCDVLVVGAGTAGTYLSWLIAKEGYSVITIEKDERENVGKRLDVIHFETDRIEKAGIPPFKVGEPDCIEIRDTSLVGTPDLTTEIKIRALQTIVRLTPFLNRMYKVLETDGVKLEFSCHFKKLLYQEGRIIGISAEKDGIERDYFARVVIDASGKIAALRTALPESYGVENFNLGPHDVMYVLLQYIKWTDPQSSHPANDTGYNWWLLWFGPSYHKDDAILGVGSPGSYEYARLAREDFLNRADLPSYEIIKEEQGMTPYRRPPYSLVGDGFLCIGDAGAITYPFSGHGVTATWMLCMIAADVIGRELKYDGYITRERLWDINARYFRDQGAKFASLYMQLSGVLNFKEKEWNYFLKKGLIYQTGEDEDIPEPNKEYEEEMSLEELLKFLGKLIWGILKGKLTVGHVSRLISVNGLAGKIKKHYENFPENVDDFDQWVETSKAMWKKKKVAIKHLSNVSIEIK